MRDVQLIAGREHLQEGVRVVVVADPSAAAELVFAFAHGDQVDLPFEVAELDFDAEFAAPHLLVGLRGHLLAFGGRVEVIELRQAFAAGVACFGQEASGFGGVLFPARGRLEAARAGRREVERGRLAGAQDFLRDEVAVDRHAERAADAWVAERLARGDIGRLGALDVAVHPDEGRREERIEPELRGLLFAQLSDLVGRHGAGDVEFAAAEGALFGEEVGDGAELDGVERDFLGVPVMRVLPDDDAAGDFPFLERERAVTDQRAGPCPERVERVDLAVPEDRGGVHRHPALVA